MCTRRKKWSFYIRPRLIFYKFFFSCVTLCTTQDASVENFYNEWSIVGIGVQYTIAAVLDKTKIGRRKHIANGTWRRCFTDESVLKGTSSPIVHIECLLRQYRSREILRECRRFQLKNLTPLPMKTSKAPLRFTRPPSANSKRPKRLSKSKPRVRTWAWSVQTYSDALRSEIFSTVSFKRATA